jgi:hypothetical protein
MADKRDPAMPYAYGFCPNCGVKYNVREWSIGTSGVVSCAELNSSSRPF